MEINITHFFNTAAPRDYSASCAEFGQDAGTITWNHACEDSLLYNMIDNDDKRDVFRDHLKGYGAWNEEEEINALTDIELNALFIQLVSGDIRTSCYLDKTAIDWERYYEEDVVHNIFKGTDDNIYYTIGN